MSPAARIHAPTLLLALLLAWTARAQEQIDQSDPTQKPAIKLADLTLRARVTKSTPPLDRVELAWRRGGEGLGGAVTHGVLESADSKLTLPLNEFSKPVPLADVAGKDGGWRFVTFVANAPEPEKKRERQPPLTDVVVEFEISEAGKVVKTISEPAPKGPTVGLAINASAPTRAAFLQDLNGLLGHAQARYDRLAKLFPQPASPPKRFGVIGHLAGYGEKGAYGVRHSTPQIVELETRTLKLLGVNGLVGENSVKLADAAGAGQAFRHTYWGGPGSGSPMGFVTPRAKGAEDQACPYDPALAPKLAESVAMAIAEQDRVGAANRWGLWWDEIGVAAKVHLETCPRCREKFADYLARQNVKPQDVGAPDAASVRPYPLWSTAAKKEPAPTAPADALRYYYTARFATEATAQLFTDAAAKMKAANVRLYAMQGPTPSWSGHSLDWHEFYDRGANTAFVFETSNRDPRSWQFESYLADIGRGLCERHGMPMGVLVKPHRGAVAQRMLSVVARGATTIEWYTYGPDYAKGDSFSQSPELLEKVAKAARFLGANEDFLFEAKPAFKARVAFCSPRSSEIWGRATDLGVTAFEDAKWVYLALRHAGIAVDVLSEQQLAEGKLDPYKAIFIPGPNLRRDAAAALKTWVEAGGTLWTDAIGLSRDEANQPAHETLTGLKDRKLETWGTVEPYKATDLKPFGGTPTPGSATGTLNATVDLRAAVGRELIAPLQPQSPAVDHFADGAPRLIRQRLGSGLVFIAADWAGLVYSADVRRPDFDMSADFSDVARLGVAWPAALPPDAAAVTTPTPTVETLPLVNKQNRRSVALINWTYKHQKPKGETLIPATDLKITLRNLGDIKSVKSATHGDLKLDVKDNAITVTLPKLDEIDLLILD